MYLEQHLVVDDPGVHVELLHDRNKLILEQIVQGIKLVVEPVKRRYG